MKRFACGAVVPSCAASWERTTDDEILAEVATHAAQAHGITDVSPELVATVRANIVDVPA